MQSRRICGPPAYTVRLPDTAYSSVTNWLAFEGYALKVKVTDDIYKNTFPNWFGRVIAGSTPFG